ncbi:hypothetical protein FIBSPDRAFT_961330 [Athelia psychrophila]|uniref:Exportin-2 central domain-containing protein n=1 Tax=Athelia psychrophila TaxID=1759441 RepID=A0A166BC56_9AGAM|nr:hypothetical protein FIBSPDRAFT_961330 [Fibularhizoctonia sp. CBS 109695]
MSVSAVWALVGAGQLPGVEDDGTMSHVTSYHLILPSTSSRSSHHPYDNLERALTTVPSSQLVSQSPRFISTAIRSGRYQDLCGAAEGLVQGATVPNVGLREAEMKQFKHTPLECIRLDLALAGAGASADVTAWHRVGAAMLQALVRSGYDGEATEIVGNWIGEGLAAYQGAKGNAGDGWKTKGSLVYLMTAVATRGKTASLSSLALCCSTWTGRRGWGGGWVWSAQRRIR